MIIEVCDGCRRPFEKSPIGVPLIRAKSLDVMHGKDYASFSAHHSIAFCNKACFLDWVIKLPTDEVRL